MVMVIFLLCISIGMQTTLAMDADSNMPPTPLSFTTKTLDYLVPESKKELDCIITAYTHRAQLQIQDIKLPSPIALFGPVGSGKSYTAKALAELIGIPYKKYDYVSLLGQSMNNDNQICIRTLLTFINQIFGLAENNRQSPYMIIFNNFDHLESFDRYLHDILLARGQVKYIILQEIKQRARHNKHFLVVCELKADPPLEENFYKHRIGIATENHENLFFSLLQNKQLMPDPNLDLKVLKLATKTPAFLKEIVRICALKACANHDTLVNQDRISFALSCLSPKPILKQICTANSHVVGNTPPDGGLPIECQHMFG